MRTFILFTALITLILSCTHSGKNQKIKSSEWLIGQWENKSKEGILRETWKKPNDSTLAGDSFFIKGKDTLHFESIVLKVNDGELLYETCIKGQNNDKAIPFPLVSETENELVFENLQNDYPQKIKYQRSTANSIIIVVSGIQAEKPISEQFKMSKAD